MSADAKLQIWRLRVVLKDPSPKKIYRLDLILLIAMWCGIARFGQRGPKQPKITNFGLKICPLDLEGQHRDLEGQRTWDLQGRRRGFEGQHFLLFLQSSVVKVCKGFWAHATKTSCTKPHIIRSMRYRRYKFLWLRIPFPNMS